MVLGTSIFYLLLHSYGAPLKSCIVVRLYIHTSYIPLTLIIHLHIHTSLHLYIYTLIHSYISTFTLHTVTHPCIYISFAFGSNIWVMLWLTRFLAAPKFTIFMSMFMARVYMSNALLESKKCGDNSLGMETS